MRYWAGPLVIIGCMMAVVGMFMSVQFSCTEKEFDRYYYGGFVMFCVREDMNSFNITGIIYSIISCKYIQYNWYNILNYIM